MSLRQGPTLDLETCPHCGINRPNLIEVENHVPHKHGPISGFWRPYQCNKCGNYVFAQSSAINQPITRLFPDARTVHSDVPADAAYHLGEAYSTLHAPSACVVACAAAVDSMLKVKGYTTGTLYTRIDKAASDHLLTSDMQKWAHHVRIGANEERHVDTGVPRPTKQDAERSVEFVEALAEILFVLPARVTKGLQNN